MCEEGRRLLDGVNRQLVVLHGADLERMPAINEVHVLGGLGMREIGIGDIDPVLFTSRRLRRGEDTEIRDTTLVGQIISQCDDNVSRRRNILGGRSTL